MKKLFLGFITLFTLTLTGCGGFADVSVNLNVDLDNKPTLKGLYPNSGMSNSSFQNSWLAGQFEELTDYKVEYSQILDSSQSISNVLASRQPYHFLKLQPGDYGSLVTDSSFLDLTALLEKYGQDILASIPDYAWEAVTMDGKIYAIPEIAAAGYGMHNDALVWNLNHLEAVGITKTPETMTEVMDAFEKLDAYYAPQNSNYCVFSLPSPQALCNAFSPAYDIPDRFFEDENGEIQPYIYHENYLDYLNLLRGFVTEGYLFSSWQSMQIAQVVQAVGTENSSVGYINYWNMNTLYTTFAANKGITTEEAKTNFDYTIRVTGDGTQGTEVQTAGKMRDSNRINYYISIPAYMGNEAAYAIDWMNTRIQQDNYFDSYVGEEGIHYDYTTSSDPEAVLIEWDNEPHQYIKLYDKFFEDVVGNSMYATGINQTVGAATRHIFEESYDCWTIMFDMDETTISDPIAITPYFYGWSPVYMAALSWIITYEQKYTIEKTQAEADDTFSYLTNTFKTRYWKESVKTEIQTYWESKGN